MAFHHDTYPMKVNDPHGKIWIPMKNYTHTHKKKDPWPYPLWFTQLLDVSRVFSSISPPPVTSLQKPSARATLVASQRWPRFAKEMVCWGVGFALGSPGEVLQTVDLWGPFQPKPFCGSIPWLFRKHWPHFSEGSSNIEAEVCPLFCNLPRRCK